jgi:hypothetical protein
LFRATDWPESIVVAVTRLTWINFGRRESAGNSKKVTASQIDPYDILAGEMAAALRDEIQTDEKGRRYRVNHAVRVSKGGVQYTFWATMGFAPHEHMERAFAQRREQVIGDLMQLKTDVDVYNDLNEGQRPKIQLVLDFSDDVAERQIQMLPKKKAGKVEAA